MAAAAAACGQHGTAIPTTKKTQSREQIRRNRENSNRRKAALLFLSNISLDGRPVRSSSAEQRRNETVPEGAELSELATKTLPEPGHRSETRSSSLSASVSCRDVKTTSTAGLLAVPPIVVLPAGSDAESAELLLGRRRDSVPLVANSNLLSPSLSASASASNSSLLPSPVGPRKSSTLLSVQSCSSVSSELRQRTRNLSGGSPRPRHTKKIHFIKNMKQYDTRGSRIVLICAKRSLCAAFSVLPYGESFYLSEPMLNHPRRRHSSGNISTSLEMGLEGFHLETYGRSVSYAQFLYPTNALVRQKPSSASDLTLQIPTSRSSQGMPPRSFTPSRLNSAVGLDLGRTRIGSKLIFIFCIHNKLPQLKDNIGKNGPFFYNFVLKKNTVII